MLNSADRLVATGFLSLLLLFSVLYIWRVRTRGHLNYERIQSVGDGAVVRQGVFEMGYWWMQPIAQTFVRLGFSANGVTWLSAAMWLLCGGLVAAGFLGFACVAGTVAAFCDTVDGLVSRLLRTSSEAGEILDGTVDRYGDVIVFGGLTIFYSGLPVMQLITLAALAGAMAVTHASGKAESLRIKVSNGFMRRPERCVTLLFAMGISAITIPTWESGFGWSHAVGLPLVAGLTLIAVIGNASAVSRLRQLASAVRREERAAG